VDERLNKIHTLIETIRNAETEFEIIMAETEPSKKRSPQKCGNWRLSVSCGLTNIQSAPAPGVPE
jgi:hypothetical protein